MNGEITLQGVTRSYGTTVRTVALHPTDLRVPSGEVVAILGPSGSGKTTLLNLIGGLDRPDGGRLVVAGAELQGLDDVTLGEFRRASVGFVFQFFNLVPSLTAWENVALAAELSGDAADVDGLLAAVGLGGLGDRFPSELSGGQQQRVAIARALAKRPALVLCDEPTGALDQETGRQVLALLRRTASERGCSVIIVTHDPGVAEWCDRVIRLRDGEIVSNTAQRARAGEA